MINISSFNLFYIALSILWEPVQSYFLNIDGAGRTVFIFTTIALIININRILNDIHRSAALRIWILLMLYSAANSIVKGFESEDATWKFFVDNYYDHLGFFFVAAKEMRDNRDKCLKTMLLSFLIYIGIGYFNLSMDYELNRLRSKMGNSLPLSCVACLFVVSCLFIKHKVKPFFFMLISAFSLYVIMLSETRKAFGAYLIIFAGLALIKLRQLLGPFLTFLILSTSMYVCVNFIINNTNIGQRITDSPELTRLKFIQNEKANDLILLIVGDRAGQYLIGPEVFSEHKATGIGLCNYMSYTKMEHRLHSEYLVQLCENGLVGFVLLLLFYRNMFKTIRKQKRGFEAASRLCVFGLLAILFINITAWTYNMIYVMSMYAIILSGLKSNNNENCHLPSPRRL